MREDFVTGRASLILGEAVSEFLADTRAIGMAAGPQGQMSAQSTLFNVIDVMDRRTSEAVKKLLTEMACAINSRGRSWRRAIEIIESQIDERYAELGEWVVGMGFAQTEEQIAFTTKAHAMIIGKRKADVLAFGQGWGAPNGVPFSQRHPVLWTAMIAFAGWLFGLIS